MIITDALPVHSILQKIAKACINVDFNKRKQESRISPHIFRAAGHARKFLGHVGEINSFFYRRMTEKVTKDEKTFDNAFGLPITARCAYAKENIKLPRSSTVHVLY
jgi:hypothetical protein